MKNLDYLFVLICTFLGRIIIFGAGLSEALVFVACISYILLNKYMEEVKTKKYNLDIDEKINKIESDVAIATSAINAVKIGGTYSNVKR